MTFGAEREFGRLVDFVRIHVLERSRPLSQIPNYPQYTTERNDVFFPMIAHILL